METLSLLKKLKILISTACPHTTTGSTQLFLHRNYTVKTRSDEHGGSNLNTQLKKTLFKLITNYNQIKDKLI